MRLNVRRADSYAVVEVSGHVDISSSPELRQACLVLVRARTPAILFDMRDVNYLDSSGVATLVECLQHMAGYGGKLALIGAGKSTRDVFAIARLDKVFTFYDSEEEALNLRCRFISMVPDDSTSLPSNKTVKLEYPFFNR